MNSSCFYLSPIFALIIGCGSPGAIKTGGDLIPNSDVVIARIDNLEHRPDWVRESELIKVADGQLISQGWATIPADHRIEAGLRIAISNATEPICKMLNQRMDFIFQNSEEGTSTDAVQSRSTGAQACQESLSGVRTAKAYWEKVFTAISPTERNLKYRIFAYTQISEQELKKAMIEIAKLHSKSPLSKDFKILIDEQAKRIVSGSLSTEIGGQKKDAATSTGE